MRRERALSILCVALVVLAAMPGVAAAATRTGGTVVVGPNETVSEDLEAFGGTVVIQGTVEGDLTAFAGSVEISGTVTGDVEASAGSVDVSGTVGGDLSGAAGAISLRDGASVGGTVEAAAGDVLIDGAVGGDLLVGGETIRLGPNADVTGDLRYDGELVRADGAAVGGEVTRDPGLSVGPGGPVPRVPGTAFAVYGVVVTLLAAAILLLVFPEFSREVVDRTVTDPVRTGGAGLLALVGIPVALVVLLVTVVGIPFSLVGLLLFVVLLWVGSLYGRYVLGAWLLSLADYENRWVALLVGVAVLLGLRRVPVPLVADLTSFVVFVLGLGAVVSGLVGRYRGRSGPGAAVETTTPGGQAGATEPSE